MKHHARTLSGRGGMGEKNTKGRQCEAVKIRESGSVKQLVLFRASILVLRPGPTRVSGALPRIIKYECRVPCHNMSGFYGAGRGGFRRFNGASWRPTAYSGRGSGLWGDDKTAGPAGPGRQCTRSAMSGDVLSQAATQEAGPLSQSTYAGESEESDRESGSTERTCSESDGTSSGAATPADKILKDSLLEGPPHPPPQPAPQS